MTKETNSSNNRLTAEEKRLLIRRNRVKEQIIDIIYANEDGISDGINFYGGREAVEIIAEQILTLIDNVKYK